MSDAIQRELKRIDDRRSEIEKLAAAIDATPFTLRDPTQIPRRQWLYGRHRIRRYVSATVSPGGIGKSSLVIVESLAMATGKPLLGQHTEECATWYINLEDPADELERRVTAACKHYGLTEFDIQDMLFVDSGRTTEIVVATMDRSGVKIAQPVVDAIKRTIRQNEIRAVIVDPFVSSHRVSENDNTAIDLVVKTWAKIAEETDTSIELVHHVRKGQSGQGEFTVDDSRGASALLAAARSARVLNRMSAEEATAADITSRFAYFRADNGKSNLAPPAERSEWYRLVSVPLGNGTGTGLVDDGDFVGVVTPWSWPETSDDMTVESLRTAQRATAEGGPYRDSPQSPAWIGVPIARALGITLDKRGKKRLAGWIETWTANGMFERYEAEDSSRKLRPHIRVGERATD